MPGKTSKTTQRKSASKTAGRRGRVAGQKVKGKPTYTYHSYIYKVMKGVAEGFTIKKSGMSTMNSIVCDIFDRLASEAGALVRARKSQTLGANEVAAATRLVFPAELSEPAGKDGKEAVARYLRATTK